MLLPHPLGDQIVAGVLEPQRDPAATLDPAIVSRMLVAESMHDVRFAHALVREAVLADIGTPFRCEY